MKEKVLKLIPFLLAVLFGFFTASTVLGANNDKKGDLKLKLESYLVKVVVDEKRKVRERNFSHSQRRFTRVML